MIIKTQKPSDRKREMDAGKWRRKAYKVKDYTKTKAKNWWEIGNFSEIDLNRIHKIAIRNQFYVKREFMRKLWSAYSLANFKTRWKKPTKSTLELSNYILDAIEQVKIFNSQVWRNMLEFDCNIPYLKKVLKIDKFEGEDAHPLSSMGTDS